MEILYEKEVVRYLNIPSIPKKEHDGVSSFKDGVAIVNIPFGRKAYAVCTYDSQKDEKPHVKKIFGLEPFLEIEKVFVVPSYMDNDTSNVDLDAESKKRAEQLATEAKELETEGTVDEAVKKASELPEWIFPEIQNIEQAQAYIKEYNRMNGIKKGRVPNSEEAVKMRLYNIYMSNKKRK